MLEQPSLLLLPWKRGETARPKTVIPHPGWERTIVNPTTNLPIGFATWENVDFQGLLAWMGRKRIRVFETEDESLLMTLHRPWSLFQTWNVFDAEECRVGHWSWKTLRDGFGVRLATLALSGEGLEFNIQGEDGNFWAAWKDILGLGRHFRFSEAVHHKPFIRMAALAGALTFPPWPEGKGCQSPKR